MSPSSSPGRRLCPAAIATLVLVLAACEQKPSTVTVKRADLQQTAAPEAPGRQSATAPDRSDVRALVAQARAPEPDKPRATPSESPPPRAAPPKTPTAAGKPAATRSVTDSELVARVKSAVLAQPLSALMFNVSVANGVVTLSGTADSAETRDKAARAAADVAGVKSVENRINVLSGS
jgi:hypothetical protein